MPAYAFTRLRTLSIWKSPKRKYAQGAATLWRADGTDGLSFGIVSAAAGGVLGANHTSLLNRSAIVNRVLTAGMVV